MWASLGGQGHNLSGVFNGSSNSMLPVEVLLFPKSEIQPSDGVLG